MAISSLMSKMMKAASKHDKDGIVDVLGQSDFFETKLMAQTHVPMINVALSGELGGGMSPGPTMFVGESRTFKTNYGLLMVKSYLDSNPEGMCIFFDNEFGAKQKYWEAFGIDLDRVLHVPFKTVEDLKKKITTCLADIERPTKKGGDRVIMFIDSISQVASKKEVEDAEEGKDKADMTRAKGLNSFWRIITPELHIKEIPLFAINSYYEDMTNQYAEVIIKGGKQGFLSCDDIWLISRSKVRSADKKELLGFDFNIRFVKSRYCKEGAMIPITVKYDSGIYKWSGLLDVARLLGFVDMRGKGRYCLSAAGGGDEDSKSYTKNEMFEGKADGMFESLIENEAFQIALKAKYSIETGAMVDDEQLKELENMCDMDTGEVPTVQK